MKKYFFKIVFATLLILANTMALWAENSGTGREVSYTLDDRDRLIRLER